MPLRFRYVDEDHACRLDLSRDELKCIQAALFLSGLDRMFVGYWGERPDRAHEKIKKAIVMEELADRIQNDEIVD